MLAHAYADENGPDKPWSILASVHADDSDAVAKLGWYRPDKDTPFLKFDTKEECEAYLKTDKTIVKVRKDVGKVVHDWKPPGHLVLECVLRDSTI